MTGRTQGFFAISVGNFFRASVPLIAQVYYYNQIFRFLVEWTRNFFKYTSIKLVGLPVNIFLADLFNTTILK